MQPGARRVWGNYLVGQAQIRHELGHRATPDGETFGTAIEGQSGNLVVGDGAADGIRCLKNCDTQADMRAFTGRDQACHAPADDDDVSHATALPLCLTRLMWLTQAIPMPVPINAPE